MPRARRAARCRSLAAHVSCHVSPWSARSSAPASSATSMRSSSLTDLGRITTPLRSNCQATAPGSAIEPPFLEKIVADLGAGAVAVVGEALDDHGHAAGGVALVGDRLVADAFELAGPPLDGPLDRVDRDRRVAGLLEHRAQGGVGRRGRRRPRGPPPRPGGSAWRRACPGPCPVAPFLCLIVAHLEWPDIVNSPLEEQLMETGDRRESSGWNAATSDATLPAQHGMVVDRWRAPRRRRRSVRRHGARMNTAGERLAAEAGRRRGRPRTSRPGGRRRCGARVMSMAPKRALIGAAVEDLAGQQDHPGAGAEAPACRRRAARRSGRTGPTTRAASTSSWTRRRAARAHRRRPGPRATDRDRRRAELSRGRRRARGRRPATRGRRPSTWGPRARSLTSPDRRAARSTLSASSPRMASPRPRLTLATMAGVGDSEWWPRRSPGPDAPGRRS